MICKYIIKLPGGSTLEIDADFGTLDVTEQLKEMISTIQEAEPSDKHELVTDFVDYIVETTRETKLNSYEISNILDKNEDNVENVIKEINDYIERGATYNNFYKALRNHLLKNPGSEIYERMGELMEARPLPSKFRKLSDSDKILGTSTLNTEIYRVGLQVNEAKHLGLSSTFLENIDFFLRMIRKNGNIMSPDTNVLLTFSNEFGLKSTNIGEYSFFKAGNPSSLFLSILKRAGSKLNVVDLNAVLRENNLSEVQNAASFFDNVDNDTLVPSPFETLLESKFNNKAVSNIIRLISDSIIPNSESLYSVIKSVVRDLNPDTYGFNRTQEAILQQQFLDREKNFNKEYIRDRIIAEAEFLEIFKRPNPDDPTDTVKDKDNYFSEMIKLDSVNYNYVKQQVEAGKDLLMVPFTSKATNKTHYNPYVITKIYYRKDGVYIEALYKKQDGTYDTFRREYSVGDDIFIRKREQPLYEYQEDVVIYPNDNTVFVNNNYKELSKNDIQTLTKTYIQPGDTTNKGMVVGVYPAYVLVEKGNKLVKQLYSEITGFNSSKLAQIKESNPLNEFDYNAYTSINDVELISEGDIIEDPTSKRKGIKALVVYKNEKNVFITVGNKDNQNKKLLAIPKQLLRDNKSRAWFHSYASFTAKDKENIINNMDVRGRSRATMSSFVDSSQVRKGDYVQGLYNGKKVYGRIVSDVSNKAVILDDNPSNAYAVIDYTDITDPQFFTTRELFSEYALSIIRMNAWKIEPQLASQGDSDNTLAEVRYVVPIDTDEETLVFMPNGYANIGSYEDTTTDLKEGTKDITKYVLNKLYEGQVGLKLYVNRKTAGSRSYKRDTTGTREIIGFADIPMSEKLKIDFLNKGVYFTIVENNKPSDNIYRIMDVEGDKIIAHLNKINNAGEILTTERVFYKNDLLQDKIIQGNEVKTPNGAIFNLYLQTGNSKMNALIKAANKNLEDSDLMNYAGVQDLINKMNNIFSNFGVDVKVDHEGEGFESSQRAKIMTSPNEDGTVNTSIILDGKKGTKYDLIHENLHIFLTLLRYSDYATYEQAIEAVIGEVPEGVDTATQRISSLLEREEKFVRKIVSAVKLGYSTDFLNESEHVVMRELYNVIKSINPDFNIDLGAAVQNPTILLNKSLKDIFNYKTDISSPYYNQRLIDSEAAFREWTDTKKVVIKCN